MTVFVDTSALYALLDRSDANHKRAVSAWVDLLKRDASLITSNYVIVENYALTKADWG